MGEKKIVRLFPFSVAQHAKDIIKTAKTDGQKAAIQKVDTVMLLFAEVVKTDIPFERIQSQFKAFQVHIKKAKIKINIQDSALKTVVRHSNMQTYLNYYVKKQDK
jgi:hypothetical protein